MCVYVRFKQWLGENGSVVSKYSAKLMGSAFSANNLAENPQKLAESGLQGLLLSHQSECTLVSWGNLEYKAKITVLVIDKSACLVKTSWSTDKEPLLMDSGLELFLFCPFPYVSSTCLLCMNIHSCNDGFVLCSLAKRKQGFTSQDTLRTLLKAPSVFAIAVFWVGQWKWSCHVSSILSVTQSVSLRGQCHPGLELSLDS